MKKEFEIGDITQLDKPAEFVADLLKQYNVFAFYGQMGAGKTTFIKEICKQLRMDDIVNSPTFALVNQYNYKPGKSIFHFDFYRINKLEEAYDMGYEDYFYSNNICFIEWPEKIGELLPEDVVEIHIADLGNNSRKISINISNI